jgi:hypothetical protein
MADFSIDTNLSGAVNSDVTADVTSTLAGLDAMNLTLAGGTTTTLAGENTVNTDSKVALAPVTTTSTVNSAVDLRPVALDSCVRLELAPPPPTEVCTPYEQQWSWSVLGLELFAVTVRGSTSTHVRPAHTDPVVIEL